MPRRPRIHTPNGLYHVVLCGHEGRPIFLGDDDYRTFSRLLPASLKRARSRLHAFCWLTHHVELAVQVSELPVFRVVQHLASQYAKWMHRKLGPSGRIFAPRYRAVLVDLDRYLPELVRYIHRAPLRAALVNDLARYPWSSHAAYLGEVKLRWLTTHVALGMLTADRRKARARYRTFVRRDNRVIAEYFEHGRPADSRVLGDDEFLASLRKLSSRPHVDGSLARLVKAAATSQQVTVHEVLSLSRRRRVVMTRALITWQATQAGLATLTEVAAHLQRRPSTLWAAVERYRAQRPELFIVPDEDAAPDES